MQSDSQIRIPYLGIVEVPFLLITLNIIMKVHLTVYHLVLGHNKMCHFALYYVYIYHNDLNPITIIHFNEKPLSLNWLIIYEVYISMITYLILYCRYLAGVVWYMRTY